MPTLVLLRHGQSTWNQENRFTGWTDVDLTAQGRAEAAEAGRLIKAEGLTFDAAYTSVLKRAIRTLWMALDELDLMWIPVHRNWRLNERHYGALQGLNKAETAARHGDDQVKIWRRSYDIPPPALSGGDPTPPGQRPALCAPRSRGAAAHRIAQGHGRALPAVLGGNHRPGDPLRHAGPDCRPRQLPARARQAPRRHLRRRHRRAEHPDGHSPGVRAGRAAAAARPAVSGRRGSGESGGRGRGAPGKGSLKRRGPACRPAP